MALNETTPWPTELRLNKDKNELTVSFEDGKSFAFPAEMLRVMSPSAEVQGHSPDQRVLVWGKKNVKIINVERVGNYAVKLHFDDLHNTGIFSWSYFYNLGRNQKQAWTQYLDELKAKGKSR
jgi:DUF971 family protein